MNFSYHRLLALITLFFAGAAASRAQTVIVTYQPNNALNVPRTTTVSAPLELTLASGGASEAGIISGAGSITKTGAGLLTLVAPNTYNGPTVLREGTLAFANSAQLGTLSRIEFNGGTARLTSSASSAYNNTAFVFTPSAGNSAIEVTTGQSATISGNSSIVGTLTKSGGGTLTLLTTNPDSFDAVINGGTLEVISAASLGNSNLGHFGTITFNGGTLATMVGGSSIDTIRVITLNAGGGTFNTADGYIRLSNAITGEGSLTKTGAGALFLAGDNTYTGGTILSGGLLQLNSRILSVGGTLASPGSPLTVNSGILNLNGFSQSVGTLSGAGGTIVSGNSGSDTNATLTVNTSNGDGHFQGVIADRATGGTGNKTLALTKIGAGTLTLSGENIYTGGTVLSAGTLQIGNGGTTGSLVGNISGSSSIATSLIFNRSDASTFAGNISGLAVLTKLGAGTLTLTGNNSHAGTIVSGGALAVASDNNLGPGTLILAGGTLISTGADFTRSQPIVLNAGGGTFEVARDADATMSLQQTYISGDGALTKTGVGNLILGFNSYAGGTRINAGTVSIYGDYALGDSSGALIFNGGSLAVINPVNPFASARSVILESGGGTIKSPGTTTLSGVISGPGSLTLIRGNTLILTGNNTYTGDTIITSPATFDFTETILQIGNGGTSGSLTGNIVVSAFSNSAARLIFNRSDDSTFAGSIDGGSLTKLGAGTLTLSGNLKMSAITVSAGTLKIGNGLTQEGYSQIGDIINYGALQFNVGSSTIYLGSISGFGSLTKLDAGNLWLGSNSYTGSTTLVDGTLTLGDAGALGSTSMISFGGGTLQFSEGNAIDYSGVFSTADNQRYKLDTNGRAVTLDTALISTGGSLTKLGGGTLTLAATNTYAGGTTVSTGTLQLGNSGTVLSDAGAVIVNGGTFALGAANETIGSLAGSGGVIELFSGSGRTLTLGGNNATTAYAGVIQGSGGSLNKTGTGTLTLTGTNTFTGGVYVFGGTLELSSGGKITNTTTSGLEGGSLKVSGAGSMWTNTMDIFIGRNGAGTLTIEQGGVVNSSFALLGRPGGNGSVYVSGATSQWNNSSGIVLGLEGGSGLLEISGGSVSNLDSAIGRDASSTGVARVSGGTWANTDFFVGGSGTGTLEISGSGSVSSSYTSVAHNSGGIGTVNLLGGMLTTGQISEGAGNGTVTFNGGTLRLSGNQSDLFNGFESGDVTLTGAGGTIDTQGFSVATATALSGNGSLTKTGAGTLTLLGANTFTGGISLNTGALTLRSALAQRTGTGIEGLNGVALTILGTPDGGTGAVVGAAGSNGAASNTPGQGGNGIAGSLPISLGDSSTLINSGTVTGGAGGRGGNHLYSGGVATGGTAGVGAGGLVLGNSATLSNTGTITGGAGGIGGNGQSGLAGGGTGNGRAGGTGGTAATLGTNATVINSLTLRGGDGGKGGDAAANAGGTSTAGVGGTGGAALLVGSSSTVTNSLTLTGGAGGVGGVTLGAAADLGGNGGNGGNAATLGDNSIFTNTSTGVLTGGKGGARGLATATHGTGGAAIAGNNLTIINHGILTGGLNGDNTQGNAITLGGTTNRLELRAGSAITGNVVAGGTTDTLTLTVDSATTFDGSRLGDTAQFRGFESFLKTGAETLTLTGTSNYGGTTTISAGTLQIGNGGTSGSFVGAITNSGALLFARSDDSGYTGILSGAGTLTKQGTGTLTLSGNNTTFTGSATLADGTLSLGSANALGAPSTGTILFTGGTLQFSASNTTDYSSRFSTAASQAYKLDTNGQTVTLATALTSSGGSLNKSGVGTLVLTGANTYNGGTMISEGTLSGNTTSLQGAITNNAALTFDQATAGIFSGNISGSGSLTKTGAGELTLSGNNSYSGVTNVNQGTLRLGSAGALSANTTLNVANGATFDSNGYAQTFTGLTGSGSVSTGSTGLTVQTSASAPTTFDGALSGTGALTINGGGSLTITGNSAATFSGATSVANATLKVNGSLAGSAVTVGNSGRLSGSGAVGALTLSDGSTLAPGNSPGTMSASATTWAGGSTYEWEINDAASPATGAGTRYDLLSISAPIPANGTLTITATAGNKFTLSLVSLLANNNAGDVINFSSAVNSSYTIATTTGGIFGFSASVFTIDNGDFTNPLNGGTWSLALANNSRDLQLNFTAAAIPEPSTYAALAGAFVLGLALYRKRQRRV